MAPSNYAGYVRTKTKQQAQDERRWGQARFDGGQNSDTPPNKIGTNEMALLVNAVSIPDRLEGHYGRVLAAAESLPGTGTHWDLKQHPVTGRWLLHRGDQLWLSAGRRQQDWTEVGVIGPDGSLTATGAFTDGSVTISGAASAYLSGMVITGAEPGQSFNIEMVDAAGPSVEISLLDGLTLVAQGLLGLGSQPATGFALAEQGGSGISATVDVDGYGPGDECIGTAVVADYALPFTLRGLTLENTDEYELYWTVTDVAGDITIRLYKDSGLTQLVAISDEFTFSTNADLPLTPQNDSGITGYFSWNDSINPIPGTWTGIPLEFVVATVDIDFNSVITFFGETGFIVNIRSDSGLTVYVAGSIGKYFFLSTSNGYGAEQAVVTNPGGDYRYRYLYTYSRIVDPTTQEPDYAANRTSAALIFEGPSNLAANSSLTDYALSQNADPISGSDPVVVTINGVGVDIVANAAAYITHLSIYRTLDIGVNGVTVDGVVNNPEIYIWVADIPIYSTTYSDTTSDAILLNRFAGGSTQGENFALRSRFYREMARGIGSIRPDFMATVQPQGTLITYCDVAVNPRFIGYYFPGSQYFLTQDPVSDIVTTKDLFVFLCPSSNYTTITAINVDGGITGISYIPSIQNFEKSSQTVGIKYGQRTFPVDDNSFVSLCSDGTVRVYSASFWGKPLDGDQVHKLTELAQVGAVLIFLRDVLYMWYTTDAADTVTTHCLRYGAGGQAGNKWSVIERANWVYPPVGGGMAAIYEDEDATLRMLVVDDAEDISFAVEDLPPLRQYKDDVVGAVGGISGTPAAFITAMALTGGDPAEEVVVTLGTSGGTNYLIEVYRDDVLVADATGPIASQPVVGGTLAEVGGSGISGTFSLSGFTAPNAYEGAYTFPGIAVVSMSEIPSTLRFAELTATQQQFICIHQESYIFMRSVYGMPVPTVGAKWYANGVLVPDSEQSSIPVAGDIQSFAQVKGRTIQIEITPASSGWQITGINSKYQTQDMRSDSGPWDSIPNVLQRELGVGLISWVNGVSGLINRASAYLVRYVGAVPALIDGPDGKRGGQSFATPVTFAEDISLTVFSIMFWIKGAVTGAAQAAAPVALLDENGGVLAFVTFTNNTTCDIGSFQYTIDPSVAEGSGWQHFCMTRSGDTFALYQNGVLVDSDVLSPGSLLAVKSFRIGSSAGTQKLFAPRIYEICLSAEAIAYYFAHPAQEP